MPMSDETPRRRSPIILVACICGYISAFAMALEVLVFGKGAEFLLFALVMLAVSTIAIRNA
jgi:hypothetical protein